MSTKLIRRVVDDMVRTHLHSSWSTVGRGVIAIGAIAAVGLGSASCRLVDDVLEVDAPTQVPADALDRPENATVLINGVIGDFNCALGSYIVAQALLGDELHDGTFTASRWPVPSRNLSGTETYGTNDCESSSSSSSRLGVYTPLSTSRWTADDAITKLDGWTDDEVEDRQQKIGVAAAHSGYAHMLLGEGMCTAAFDLGPEMQPAEIFERAEERFTRAIEAAVAAADDSTLNMARVGRARVRRNLGNLAGAAEDATLVPDGFVQEATRSDNDERSRNAVAAESPWSNGSGTAGANTSVAEPYRNLEVDGVPDPRVPVTDMEGTTGDAVTPNWRQDKYQDPDESLPIARSAEAQLIIAEAEGGQTAVDIINALRAVHGLPEFSSTNESEIQAQVREERRSELFLEGHRLGDMRLYDLPQFPAVGAPYNKGGTYGDARCFPLPAVERRNNPNIS